MRKALVAFSAVLALAACKKTGEGEYQVQTPKVSIGTDTQTVLVPTLGTKKDTLNVPVVGTKKDTIIIDKPVITTKKATVTRPVIKTP